MLAISLLQQVGYMGIYPALNGGDYFLISQSPR
jgi:hypothetical protein